MTIAVICGSCKLMLQEDPGLEENQRTSVSCLRLPNTELLQTDSCRCTHKTHNHGVGRCAIDPSHH